MPFRKSISRLRLKKNFRNQFAGSNQSPPRAPDGHYYDNIPDNGLTYNNTPEDQFYNALETDILTYNDFKYFPLITEMDNLYEDNANNENNVNVVASVEEMFRNIVVSPKDFRDLNNILKAEAEAINPLSEQEINRMIQSLLDNKDIDSLNPLIFICNKLLVGRSHPLWINLLSKYFDLSIKDHIEANESNLSDEDYFLQIIRNNLQIAINDIYYNTEDLAIDIFTFGSLFGSLYSNSKKYRLFSYKNLSTPTLTQENVLKAYGTKDNIVDIVIPDSVTTIGEGAFYGCSSLVTVTIPDSVTSIGWRAFRGCSSLATVTIPDSVTSIGFQAFCYCSSLATVTIPNSVTTIGEAAFHGCSSLRYIVMSPVLKNVILTSNIDIGVDPAIIISDSDGSAKSPSNNYNYNGGSRKKRNIKRKKNIKSKRKIR